jgi:hypothetical protein
MTEPSNPFQTPAAAPPAQPPGMPPVVISDDDRMMAMLCHLLAIFTGFIGPLVLWLVKKDSSPFVAHHGKESLNFQITLLLVMTCLGAATFILMFVLIGIVLVPVLILVPVLALVAEIIAAVAAQKGEWFRYPCCIRFA